MAIESALPVRLHSQVTDLDADVVAAAPGPTAKGVVVHIATQPAGGAGLTDTELRATPVPVSGSLTDGQLRATAVPVSGTVTASGPLTDTQLRATPVPVSGPLTDGQLRATPVPVSGTVTAAPIDDDTASGSIASLGTQAYLLAAGRSSISWQFGGTWTGTAFFEKSLDNSVWEPMAYVASEAAGSNDVVTETTVNGIYFSSLGSTQRIRVRRGSGTGTLNFNTARSVGVKVVALNKAIPTGSNQIGGVDLRRALTPAFASIDAAGSGDNTLVAADSTRKIKVLSYVVVADAAVTARWKSGAGTNLSGAMSLAANGGISAPPVAPAAGHWFETAVNQALVLNLGGALGVRGHLSYVLEA